MVFEQNTRIPGDEIVWKNSCHLKTRKPPDCYRIFSLDKHIPIRLRRLQEQWSDWDRHLQFVYKIRRKYRKCAIEIVSLRFQNIVSTRLRFLHFPLFWPKIKIFRLINTIFITTIVDLFDKIMMFFTFSIISKKMSKNEKTPWNAIKQHEMQCGQRPPVPNCIAFRNARLSKVLLYRNNANARSVLSNFL